MPLSNIPSRGSLLYPDGYAAPEWFPTVSTITRGDAVTYDSTVPTYLATTIFGCKTAPAGGADLATVFGICDADTTGTQTVPADAPIITKGVCYKAKVANSVVAGDPLVLDTVAGQLIKATAANIGGIKAAALTSAGTLIDGTTAAGFCSVYVFGG